MPSAPRAALRDRLRAARRAVICVTLCAALAACGPPRSAARSLPSATPTTGSPAAIATTATLVVLASLGRATPTATSLQRASRAGALTLRVGEEVPLGEGGASVRFERVVEDSRCPANARCIWQGRVVVELSVIGGGQPTPFTLGTLGGFADAPATVEAAGRTLSIADVEPYPKDATAIREEQYVLTLVVS